jgi:hypothetical protein
MSENVSLEKNRLAPCWLYQVSTLRTMCHEFRKKANFFTGRRVGNCLLQDVGAGGQGFEAPAQPAAYYLLGKPCPNFLSSDCSPWSICIGVTVGGGHWHTSCSARAMYHWGSIA